MLELIVRIKALVGRAFVPRDIPQDEVPTKFVIGDYQLNTMKEHLVYMKNRLTYGFVFRIYM